MEGDDEYYYIGTYVSLTRIHHVGYSGIQGIGVRLWGSGIGNFEGETRMGNREWGLGLVMMQP
jgi:hypothetical protein